MYNFDNLVAILDFSINNHKHLSNTFHKDVRLHICMYRHKKITFLLQKPSELMKIIFICLSRRPFWLLSFSYFCSAAIWVNFIFLKITYNYELKSIKKPFEVILLNFNVLFTGLFLRVCLIPLGLQWVG